MRGVDPIEAPLPIVAVEDGPAPGGPQDLFHPAQPLVPHPRFVFANFIKVFRLPQERAVGRVDGFVQIFGLFALVFGQFFFEFLVVFADEGVEVVAGVGVGVDLLKDLDRLFDADLLVAVGVDEG